MHIKSIYYSYKPTTIPYTAIAVHTSMMFYPAAVSFSLSLSQLSFIKPMNSTDQKTKYVNAIPSVALLYSFFYGCTLYESILLP